MILYILDMQQIVNVYKKVCCNCDFVSVCFIQRAIRSLWFQCVENNGCYLGVHIGSGVITLGMCKHCQAQILVYLNQFHTMQISLWNWAQKMPHKTTDSIWSGLKTVWKASNSEVGWKYEINGSALHYSVDCAFNLVLYFKCIILHII